VQPHVSEVGDEVVNFFVGESRDRCLVDVGSGRLVNYLPNRSERIAPPSGTESEGMHFRNGDATGLSRRQLLREGGLALTGITGAGLLDVTSAFGKPSGGKAPSAPRPIPGGFDENFNLVSDNAAFHFFPPGIGFDMSTITDFNGIVGGSEIRGTAHGTDRTTYDFDTDMRFMRGVYIGLDRRVHAGSFGFI
jgi:hypothetical protein